MKIRYTFPTRRLPALQAVWVYSVPTSNLIMLPFMTLTLTLVRGLPGSGKSTLAKAMPGRHLEADMYFVNEHGEYHYHPEKIQQAHQWCQRQAQQWLAKGESVVVSNTFVRHWEMKVYKQLAKRYKARLKIIICRGQFQNIHEVDDATVERMRQQWQE
ncbi:conserved hypothetical protein [Vibrio aestuarianus]|nr:conserved hypothetical protein [Vibrio aestuarianus]